MSRRTKALILAVIVYAHVPAVANQIMIWADVEDPVIDQIYDNALRLRRCIV